MLPNPTTLQYPSPGEAHCGLRVHYPSLFPPGLRHTNLINVSNLCAKQRRPADACFPTFPAPTWELRNQLALACINVTSVNTTPSRSPVFLLYSPPLARRGVEIPLEKHGTLPHSPPTRQQGGQTVALCLRIAKPPAASVAPAQPTICRCVTLGGVRITWIHACNILGSLVKRVSHSLCPPFSLPS